MRAFDQNYDETEPCALCGAQPATGWAWAGDFRLCHGVDTPTCYERASGAFPAAKTDDEYRAWLQQLWRTMNGIPADDYATEAVTTGPAIFGGAPHRGILDRMWARFDR